MPELTRRNMLGAAGGLILLPWPRTEATAEDGQPAAAVPPPIFTAIPYLQPGNDGPTGMVVAWQTDNRPCRFLVEVDEIGPVVPERTERMTDDDGELRWNYAARIRGLTPGRKYRYRVVADDRPIAEGWFTAVKPRGTKTRFVAFGDNSYGDISDRMNAYQAWKLRPDFVMNTGDNVYPEGTDSQYARMFFPVYNADEAGPRIGAPLLRSVPFYTVVANHDVRGKDKDGKPVVDFDALPDAFAYCTSMILPLNGPPSPQVPPLVGNAQAIAHFRACAGDRFPNQLNYRFDYGDLHFLCLDSNLYVDPNDRRLQQWIEDDLRATDAAWKLVVFHHPSFNAGEHHFTQQHMRVLSPIFERCGVDMVLHGHEHTYQRTRPLRFTPTDTRGASNVGSKARLIPGNFQVDRRFDGRTQTVPDGIVYVTTGAGGKALYEPEWGQTARTHAEDGHIDYMARWVSDRHSLTVFDVDRSQMRVRQIDQWGGEVDRFTLRKKA